MWVNIELCAKKKPKRGNDWFVVFFEGDLIKSLQRLDWFKCQENIENQWKIEELTV